MADLYDLTARTAEGGALPLSEFRGRPMLIVNTASKCGFTPQYEGLERLHRDYGPNSKYGVGGLTVLAFPCNQFGKQEPGDAAEIASFCTTKYDVTFPVLGKVEVNGAKADPIFRALKVAAPGALGTEAIKWNFTKFLVDREGRVVSRHAPTTAPEKLRGEIENLLG